MLELTGLPHDALTCSRLRRKTALLDYVKFEVQVKLAAVLAFLPFALLAFALSAVAMPAQADEPSPTQRQWRFQVFLDDTEIGYHDFFLEQRGESQVMRTVAEFEYKLLFVKLYDYAHENSEEWQDGCLSRIESSTDDNGKTFAVLGRQQPGAFVVQANRGAASLPPCVMSFAYWDPGFLKQKQLLNSQNGDFVEVQVSAPETTELEVQGEMRKAMRYHLAAGPLKLQLWYSMDSEWLGLESETESGRVLRYKLL